MKYSYKFEQDLMKIKKIMDRSKRSEAIIKVARAYQISPATIYRQLKNKVPGIPKLRSDAGKDKTPVSKKERDIISELVRSGKTRIQAKEILEELENKKISTRKLSKISKKVKETSPQSIEQANLDTTVPSNFGSGALELIKKLFDLDLVAPDAGIKFKYKEVVFFLTKKHLEDIASICSTAYNNYITGDSKKLKGDHIDQLRQQLYYDIQELRRIAQASGKIKDVEALTRMFDRLKTKNATLTPDFYVLEKCLKELKPEITREQVIALVKKNSDQK